MKKETLKTPSINGIHVALKNLEINDAANNGVRKKTIIAIDIERVRTIIISELLMLSLDSQVLTAEEYNKLLVPI